MRSRNHRKPRVATSHGNSYVHRADSTKVLSRRLRLQHQTDDEEVVLGGRKKEDNRSLRPSLQRTRKMVKEANRMAILRTSGGAAVITKETEILRTSGAAKAEKMQFHSEFQRKLKQPEKIRFHDNEDFYEVDEDNVLHRRNGGSSNVLAEDSFDYFGDDEEVNHRGQPSGEDSREVLRESVRELGTGKELRDSSQDLD